MMSTGTSGRKNHQAVSLEGVDPETCMIVFKTHWAQVMELRRASLVLIFKVDCVVRNPLKLIVVKDGTRRGIVYLKYCSMKVACISLSMNI